MGWAITGAVLAGLMAWWWVPPGGLGRLEPSPVPRRLVTRGSTLLTRLKGVLPTTAEVQRDEELRASAPVVCDLMALCLDAGRPPRAALRVVVGQVSGPAREELEGVLARIDLGVDEAEAWNTLGRVPGFREVGRDLARSVRSGLGLAGLLRQHAVAARAEADARALARARAAGVRSVVPLMLCFLPAFLLLGVIPLFGALVGGLW
ncbi:MAG: type II secretion system F family protein [Propionibacteriaceae bacterium]|nr:type II secretion system F family protein [Propionibacteriaceae bacterium]